MTLDLFSPIHDYSKYCYIFYYLSIYSFLCFFISIVVFISLFFSSNKKLHTPHVYLASISTAITYFFLYLVLRTLFSMCLRK